VVLPSDQTSIPVAPTAVAAASNPSYTEGVASVLSQDTAGNLRVNSLALANLLNTLVELNLQTLLELRVISKILAQGLNVPDSPSVLKQDALAEIPLTGLFN
jgi:hypothetical protein